MNIEKGDIALRKKYFGSNYIVIYTSF